ncbi:hypothetical protein glysoja_014972 [Glycine soja]|nr:hypothetical protein glysoja_014972 [Glycine soja]
MKTNCLIAGLKIVQIHFQFLEHLKALVLMDPFIVCTICEKKNEKVLTECYTTLHVSECNFSCQNSPIIKVKE